MERKYKKRSNLVNNTGYTPGYASEKNPMNIIPINKPGKYITMENTPYPVYGQPLDEYGNPIDNPTYMKPGMNYDYGSAAAYVAEVPAYKVGGQKNDWISNKIQILMGEGRPQKQAIAIAYSMWNQKHEMGGEQLPMYQVGTQVPTKSIFETYPQTTNVDSTPKIEPIVGQMAPIKLQGSGLSGIPTQTTPKIDGTWYENNPAGMQTSFGGPQKIEPGKIQPVKMQGPTNSLGVNQTELNSIEKQLKQKPLTNDGGAKAREDATGSGITQFVNPYGDVGMEDALGFSGQQFAKGNTGMGIAGAALGALKGTKSFLQGMGAQKRQDQIMKGYAEDQRKYMTGEGNEVAIGRRGGYFQDGATYRDEPASNMSSKNPQFTEQRRKLKEKARQEEEVEPVMEVNPVFGPQNREYDDTDQVTEYSDPNEMTKEQADSFMDMYNKDQESKNSTSARDTWEQKTGMSWSKAKELGYTDGSAKDNMKLLSELNDPRFKKENLRTKPSEGTKTKPATNKTTPRKADKKLPKNKTAEDYTYQDFQNAMKGKLTYNKNQGEIRTAPEEYSTISRAAEILGNPLQSFGHYAKYGELPAEGFSKNDRNNYDQVIGMINPASWASAARNAVDYTRQGEYKRAGSEAIEALPGAGKLLRYVPKAAKLAKAEEVVAKAAGQWKPKGAGQWTPVNRQLQQTLREVNKIATTGKKLPFLDVATRPAVKAALKAGAKASGRKFEYGGYFQDGGMQPEMEEEEGAMMGAPEEEQGGEEQMQQIAQQVGQMLQQGADPQEVMQQLVEMGIPEEEAQQIIQMVIEQMQGGQQQATPQLGYGGQMMKRADGSYSRRGLWDNIRDNAGSGKKPTKEMLEQERKIKSEYEYGGMYDMEEYAEGGTIPDRYKNDGFTKVGVKRQSNRPGKKWMVLAKKGDQYKVVHGGDSNMKDFSQHGSEDRKENFWNRMGGRNSSKANDPFSPLYWHKRFGTWQEGGEIMDEQMEGEDEGTEGETPNMEQIESQVEQALKQGADPQEILQQLVEMGMPEELAVQMIQELLQEIQGGETEQEAPEQGQPMMKNGGEYLNALKGRTIKNYTYNKNTGNYDVEFE